MALATWWLSLPAEARVCTGVVVGVRAASLLVECLATLDVIGGRWSKRSF